MTTSSNWLKSKISFNILKRRPLIFQGPLSNARSRCFVLKPAMSESHSRRATCGAIAAFSMDFFRGLLIFTFFSSLLFFIRLFC
jgi:hypothetical protein